MIANGVPDGCAMFAFRTVGALLIAARTEPARFAASAFHEFQQGALLTAEDLLGVVFGAMLRFWGIAAFEGAVCAVVTLLAQIAGVAEAFGDDAGLLVADATVVTMRVARFVGAAFLAVPVAALEPVPEAGRTGGAAYAIDIQARCPIADRQIVGVGLAFLAESRGGLFAGFHSAVQFILFLWRCARWNGNLAAGAAAIAAPVIGGAGDALEVAGAGAGAFSTIRHLTAAGEGAAGTIPAVFTATGANIDAAAAAIAGGKLGMRAMLTGAVGAGPFAAVAPPAGFATLFAADIKFAGVLLTF